MLFPHSGSIKLSMANRPPLQPVTGCTPQETQYVNGRLLQGLSKKDAALAAGYAKKNASKQGLDIEKRPRVQAYMNKLRNGQTAIAVAMAGDKIAEVIQHLQDMATADPVDAFNDDGSVRPLSEWPRALRHCLASMKPRNIYGKDEFGNRTVVGTMYDIKFHPKVQAAAAALEQAGAMAPKRHEHVHANLGDLLSANEEQALPAPALTEGQVVEAVFEAVEPPGDIYATPLKAPPPLGS